MTAKRGPRILGTVAHEIYSPSRSSSPALATLTILDYLFFESMKQIQCLVRLLMVFGISSLHAADFDTSVRPFFAKYCGRCHGETDPEGEFRLDSLSRDFGDESIAGQWNEVLFRMNKGEMPPVKELQPGPEELGQVADWISARITEGRAARMARRGSVAHYRLSRDEYGYAIYDLLGAHFDARMPGALNEDPRWHGYDRIGSMLTLSPSHVNRYLTAAETVLRLAFPWESPEPQQRRQEAGAPNRWLILPGHRQGGIDIHAPGLYQIRIRLSALPSFRGRMARLSIWNNSLKRTETGRDVRAPEDEPTIVEFDVFLPKGGFQLTNESPGKLDDGHTLNYTPRSVTKLTDYRPSRPTGYRLFTDDEQPIFPLLLVDWLEYEGPVQTTANQQKRYGLIPSRGQLARSSSDRGQMKSLLQAVRKSLELLMARAWRRPPTDAEIDRYTKIVETELAAGESPHSAYLAAMTGVLASKNFFYIVEGSQSETRDQINDWELASRLSFFLWSSMPDEELFAAARDGTLHEPEVLRAQLNRMMGNAKISRFTDSFPRQWLQLHRVGMFPPDSGIYPDYDGWLEQSMVLETTGFFREMFVENMSICEFLSSDWTVMNSRLALHYGMTTFGAAGFQRIRLQPEDHRGGLLTQASVLSLSSDGTRHRPVHRGVWVSEAIFGTTPPPPPPNVEPLEPTPSNKTKATIRDQLETHGKHAVCASCHRKIDPLGFAFDNFDAIGRWRTREQVSGGLGDDPLVNSAGVLPDGRAYSGPNEFKQLLADSIDRFAETFVEQLATFALRRVMTIDDAPQIRAIAHSSQPDDYRLRAIIENLVMSNLFRMR